MNLNNLDDMTEDEYNIHVIRPTSDRHYKDIARLAGYERESRFEHEELWQDCLKSRNEQKQLVVAYVSTIGVETNNIVSTGNNKPLDKKKLSYFTGEDLEDEKAVPVGYIVGHESYRVVSPGSPVPRGQSVQIISFAVHPAFRRKGIATQMFFHLFLTAEVPVIVHMKEINDFNLEACCLLRKLNFPNPLKYTMIGEGSPFADGYYFIARNPSELLA